MTEALEVGEWSAARPGRTLPPRKTRYPLYRRLGGPQGRSGRAENLAPPGFDPRTIQPVVTHYTDWATRPTLVRVVYWKLQQGNRWNLLACYVSSSIIKGLQIFKIYYLQFVVPRPNVLEFIVSKECLWLNFFKIQTLSSSQKSKQGTAVAQWLRCCATNRKVAGSIPDGVIGNFHWHNPSDRTMALGSTQPLTEMSTRRISWG
jgi:hypothetical protein